MVGNRLQLERNSLTSIVVDVDEGGDEEERKETDFNSQENSSTEIAQRRHESYSFFRSEVPEEKQGLLEEDTSEFNSATL